MTELTVKPTRRLNPLAKHVVMVFKAVQAWTAWEETREAFVPGGTLLAARVMTRSLSWVFLKERLR